MPVVGRPPALTELVEAHLADLILECADAAKAFTHQEVREAAISLAKELKIETGAWVAG